MMFTAVAWEENEGSSVAAVGLGLVRIEQPGEWNLAFLRNRDNPVGLCDRPLLQNACCSR